jgi:hypothetical protein
MRLVLALLRGTPRPHDHTQRLSDYLPSRSAVLSSARVEEPSAGRPDLRGVSCSSVEVPTGPSQIRNPSFDASKTVLGVYAGGRSLNGILASAPQAGQRTVTGPLTPDRRDLWPGAFLAVQCLPHEHKASKDWRAHPLGRDTSHFATFGEVPRNLKNLDCVRWSHAAISSVRAAILLLRQPHLTGHARTSETNYLRPAANTAHLPLILGSFRSDESRRTIDPPRPVTANLSIRLSRSWSSSELWRGASRAARRRGPGRACRSRCSD